MQHRHGHPQHSGVQMAVLGHCSDNSTSPGRIRLLAEVEDHGTGGSGSRAHLAEPEQYLVEGATEDAAHSLLPRQPQSHTAEHRQGHHKRIAGPSAGLFNILKSCMGVGILAVPSAMAKSGWLVGGLLLLLAAVLAAYGCFLLSACAHRMGGTNTSFFMLFHRTFPRMAPLADILIIIECWGSAVGYLIIIGDDMAELAMDAWGVAPGSLWASSTTWKTLFFWVIIAPLTALPKLSMLQASSSVGVGCVLLYCCMAVVLAAAPGAHQSCGADALPESCRGDVVMVSGGVLSTMSIYFFSFAMHMKLFLVYNETREPSIARMTNRITNPAVAIAFLIIFLTGMSAYLTYGDAVEDNFLLSYPDSKPLVKAGIMANVFSVTASSPLTLHPARASAITLIDQIAPRLAVTWPTKNAAGSTLPAAPNDAKSYVQGPRGQLAVWWASTALLLVLTFIPSLLVHSLGVFLSFVGAVAGTSLIMWCPGFAFHRLFRDEERLHGCLADDLSADGDHADGNGADSEQAGEPAACVAADAGSSPLFTRNRLAFHRRCSLAMGWGGVLVMLLVLGVDLSRV